MLSWRTGRGRAAMPCAAGAVLTLVAAVAVSTTSCTGAAPHDPAPPVPLAPRTRSPAAATSVLTGTADVIADEVAARLFASSPVVVVASPEPSAGLAAAREALRAHAPVLLTSAPAGGATTTNPFSGTAAPSPGTAAPSPGTAAVVSATLRAQLRALDPRAVLAVGVAASVLAAQLPGIRVVTDPALLPATKAPAPLDHVALLAQAGDGDAATLAAVATAQVAGAHVIAVRGDDPRADPAAISALSAIRPQQVLAVGSGFGPPGRLAARIAVAQTGVQLPGGGQVLFPSRLLVALYGHPYAPALGVLGQRGLSASIARAKSVAGAYRSLSHARVVPAFEIIATVAQAHAGPDGNYSYESPVSSLRPWVRQATAAGLYVILDLQPGRASLLAQAERYQSLLERPDVGLALDAEWKLAPGQLPLQQIGSVSATEVNSVIKWLAGLTARYRLPQKVLVLHQFRLSMIRNEHSLDVRYDDLAIVIHMDGQGTPGDKQQTWEAVTGAAPAGVFFGWKNFYVKDHPTLSPRQTISRTPRLSMISYQ